MERIFGIIGLGVMGRSLALNLAEQGFPISVYSREQREVDAFRSYEQKEASAFLDLQAFVNSLGKPRTILLMITAGSPVDETIERLIPLLSQGDILIDGGNSYFKDTIRRSRSLESHGLQYIGCGISGGEAGARHGASLMPGGSREAWEHARPYLEALAAKDDQGNLCCRYVGPDGAGHFVKMVHNGIEYADMQLIGEAYAFMKHGLGLSAKAMRQIFARWNQGVLRSYLIGITADILGKTDAETGNPLVEMILDQAGQKGTGKWTAQEALDLGVPAPTLAEAVFSRCISAIKMERLHAAKILTGPCFSDMKIDAEEAINSLEKALYACKVSIYAQGLTLIQTASRHYGWSLDMAGVASVWRAGCIIQAGLVGEIQRVFAANAELEHLFLAPYFQRILAENQTAWRSTVVRAVEGGLPMAAMSSALAYYDGYRSERLPANLLQAQRDYFGAHTYERTDREGRFHTDWLTNEETVKSNPV